ncbi:lipopolysaccharide biosynthesis protein [Novosphingobium sp.]|uniref:lipopolysaccharide biosynthesis protein n=1 Tax=Novosphingobium sp. TaxID=1874826 RepID=UPI003B525DF2
MRSFFAQIYAQASGILIQLALVPVLIHAWGTELYGTWLLLTAVPFYLTFSDFGFTFIAKNEMVMAVAAGDKPAAVRTFQSVFVMLSCAIPVVFIAMAGPPFLLDLSHLLSLHGYPNAQARLVFAVLVLNVALYQYFPLLCGGIRAENRPATEAMLAATSRLCEGLLIAVVALRGGDLLAAASASLVNRIVFLGITYLWMRRLSPWVDLGWRHARMAEIRRLFHPALAYMFMPLAQAVMIQGPVLVIGHILDPVMVVTFATSRTLARLGTAGTNMLTNSFITEFAARAGQGDRVGFAALFRTELLLCGVAIAGYVAGIILLDDRLMHLFTHGKVPILEPFFGMIVAGVVAEMIWQTLFTPISAVNRHRSTTYTYSMLCLIGIVACYLMTRQFGVIGASAYVLGVNAIMIPVTAVMSRPERLLDAYSQRKNLAAAST